MTLLEKEKIAENARVINYLDELSLLNNQLVNMQRELTKKSIELEKANELKNQFLDMVVHDLRNPLSIVLSFSQFLTNDFINIATEKQLYFLKHIESSAKFMLSMVNDLVDISGIEAGKLELNLQETDMASVMENDIQIMRVLANKKQISIDYHYEKELPRIMVDIDKIKQLVYNLISNAIKFSNFSSKVSVLLYKEDDYIVIAVIDNGLGIPENEMDRLFKPFGRTSIKSTNGEKSTGLGLVICKRIIEAHSGRITVESEYGAGSRFIVYIPINQANLYDNE